MTKEELFNEARRRFKHGDSVISPMTGKGFTVDKIAETWHGDYIKGFDGKHFYDVVWFNGKWAVKV